MSTARNLNGNLRCELGAPEVVHGLAYRYCGTCGVYHPDEDAADLEVAAPAATPVISDRRNARRLKLIVSRT
jgi:hypothetical protein